MDRKIINFTYITRCKFGKKIYY